MPSWKLLAPIYWDEVALANSLLEQPVRGCKVRVPHGLVRVRSARTPDRVMRNIRIRRRFISIMLGNFDILG